MTGGARRIALRALTALEQRRVDRLDSALDLSALTSVDRDLALELARGVERMRILIDWILAGFVARGLPRNPTTLSALRLGAYQLLWLDRIPARAAVHETVELLGHDRGFVNAVLRRLGGAIAVRAAQDGELDLALELGGGGGGGRGPARTLVLPRPLPADPLEQLALRHGLPAWLVQHWERAHGRAGARQAAAASSSTPPVALRANRLRADPAQLAARLAAEEVATEPIAGSNLLRWSGGRSPFASAAFAAGWFVAQDPTAAAAAEAVSAQPGEQVLDLCAAPGTKTALLAAEVAPGGRVFAFELDPERRPRIAENVTRLGLGELVTVLTALDQAPVADAVLVDAPCSNTGVLARRLEVRRRLEPAALATLAATQREILAQAFTHVRPGGRVVYATCSLEPEENRGVVDAALAALAQGARRGRVVREQLTLPAAGVHDGGYFAVLEVA